MLSLIVFNICLGDMMRLLGFYTLFSLTFILISYQPAYAYIDPATGSYLLQIILAGLLGALFAIKMFWKNLKLFFGKLFNKSGYDPDDD